MTTIKNLAAVSGLSKSTVSRVINNAQNVKPETRERVMEAVQKLGYQPNILARGMVTGFLPMVLVIVGDIQNHFFTEPLAGIKETLQQRDFMVVVYDNGYDDRQEAEAIRKAKVCRFAGIIPMTGFGSKLVQRELEAAGCPVVLLNCHRENKHFDRVYPDDYQAGRAATEALIRHGYRRIYHFSGKSATSTISSERERGYREAMQAAGLPVTPDMVCEGDLRQGSGYALAKKCLDQNEEPVAICCNNFQMCVGIMSYAQQRGLVPHKDFDVAICEQPPSFYETTNFIYAGPMKQDIGKVAANMLLDRMRDPTVGRRTEVLSSVGVFDPQEPEKKF